MASVAGSSSDAFFWVASRMKVSDRITSSSARIDFLRPTKRGAIMCGNTTVLPRRDPPVAATTEGDGPGKEYEPPQRYPRPKGKYDTCVPSQDLIRIRT